MRIKTFVFLLILHHITFGQTVSNVKITQTTNDFKTVRDSIVKTINSANSIAIKTCEDFREFYLTKDSTHWTGYFIKNLIVEVAPPTSAEVIDGVTHYYRPIITTLISFNADSLYIELNKRKLNQIKQFSNEDIRNKMRQHYKKNGSNCEFAFAGCSHDCNMTINVDTKFASYSKCSLIDNKELYIIPTIKIFHEIDKFLIDTFKNYYH